MTSYAKETYIINKSILNIRKERLVAETEFNTTQELLNILWRSWSTPECCVKKISFSYFHYAYLQALYHMSNIQNMSLEDIMGGCFGRYSKYII